MASRIAVLATLILVSLPSVSCAATGARGRVDDLVLHQSIEGLPFEEAHRLGPGALPRLAEILADTTLKPYWATTTGAIGAVGGTRAFRILHAFVWKRFSGPVDQPTYAALTGAVSALGFTCGADDRRVVQVLESHADPDRWSDVRWYRPEASMTEMRAMLSKLSLQGLGFCGSPGALKALLRLKRDAHGDRLEMIEGAIQTHGEVARSGIVAYMARQKR